MDLQEELQAAPKSIFAEIAKRAALRALLMALKSADIEPRLRVRFASWLESFSGVAAYANAAVDTVIAYGLRDAAQYAARADQIAAAPTAREPENIGGRGVHGSLICPPTN